MQVAKIAIFTVNPQLRTSAARPRSYSLAHDWRCRKSFWSRDVGSRATAALLPLKCLIHTVPEEKNA